MKSTLCDVRRVSLRQWKPVTREMTFKENFNEDFIEEIDQEIINAVKKVQFLNMNEIWSAVNKKYAKASPALVLRRIENLVQNNLIGYFEQKVGDRTLRRFYCLSPNFNTLVDQQL